MSSRMKAGIWYSLQESLIILGVCALLVLAIVSVMSLLFNDQPSGGTFAFLQFVMVILGYQAVEEPHRVFIQNGYSRRQIFAMLTISLVISAAALTTVMIAEALIDLLFNIGIATNISNYRSYFSQAWTFHLVVFLEYFLETLFWTGLGFIYASIWKRLNVWGKRIFWVVIAAVVILIGINFEKIMPIFGPILATLFGFFPQGPNPWPFLLTLTVTTGLCFLGARFFLRKLQLKR